MMVVFKIWPENIKKAFITLQDFRFKLNSPNQTCILSKSTIQLIETIFPDSAIVIEKKTVKNLWWAKSEFLWAKKKCIMNVGWACMVILQQCWGLA